MNFEIILAALAGTTALGFFLGRTTSTAKDHQAAIISLAYLSRDDRTAVLGMPALSTGTTSPQAAEVAGAVLPTLPLFTDAEKTAILKEVSDWQKNQVSQGKLFTQGQLVTQDEIDLKAEVFPSTVMAGAGPLRYAVLNVRQ